jgi:hypothetical protein
MPLSSAPVMLETWNAMMHRTAMPRSESKSAKRGLPGGGATAGDGAPWAAPI